MFATVRVPVDVDRDRLVHPAARERPLLEPVDRLAHRRRVHVRRLDDDGRRQRRAGERLLHPVVRLARRRATAGTCPAPACAMRSCSAGAASASSSAAGEDRRQHGPAQDAVDDRAPDPAFAVVAAEPADERDAQPVDLVAEPREQRGQHGQRAEHRDRDDEDRRDAERGERRVAGQEHAGHRHHHGQAGDEHRAAGGRGGGLERRPLAAPGGPLLRARASSRTSSSRRRPRARSGARAPAPASAIGSRWLGSAISPNVAKTAVSASSSGMPAATSAPKASTRMISVIGSESSPAFARSLP